MAAADTSSTRTTIGSDVDTGNLRRRVPPIGWFVRVLRMDVATAVPPTSPPTGPRRGARDQFDDFYRANYAPVVRLAYSLSGTMPVAEELAQEAFIEAHRRWRRLMTFDRPDLWVRRVVINRSISHLRRSAAERRAMQRARTAREHVVEIELDDDEVWAALRTLPVRQAQVMALVYVEDRAISDVAEILGVGEETVRTHLKRGRAAMARSLEPMIELSGPHAAPTPERSR